MIRYSIIIFSLLLACTISLLPLPNWMLGWQPNWVLLVLLFWGIHFPQTVNVGTAWIMGILMDLLTGSLLGEHAFCFVFILFLALRIQLRLKLSPRIQQSMTISMFYLIYLFVLYCLRGFQGQFPQYSFYWGAPLVCMFFWPLLTFILSNRFRLNR